MSTEAPRTLKKDISTAGNWLRNRSPKEFIGAAVLVAAGLGAAQSANGDPVVNKESEPRPDIVRVNIGEGANIRTSAGVQDMDEFSRGNALGKAPTDITIETPRGVATVHDTNGEWYGVDAKVVAAEVAEDNEELASAILGDQDQTVWVNDDRASVETEK